MIVQEYLPAVADGNKRLFLLDGEIVGAVLRRPVRGRLPDRPAGRGSRDRRRRPPRSSRPSPRGCSRHGIALAGLDVIDGRLIEVNVTCPGGMHKTDALLGTDLSGAIVRRLLQHRLIRPKGTPRMNTLPSSASP